MRQLTGATLPRRRCDERGGAYQTGRPGKGYGRGHCLRFEGIARRLGSRWGRKARTRPSHPPKGAPSPRGYR